MQSLHSLKFLANPNKTESKHLLTVKDVPHLEFERVGERLAVRYPVRIFSYQHGGTIGWYERKLIEGFLVDNSLDWTTASETIPATLTRGSFIFQRTIADGAFMLTVQALEGKKARQIEKIVLESKYYERCKSISSAAYLKSLGKIDICTAKDLTGKLHLLVLEPYSEDEFAISAFSEK